jgi:cytidine deaminase
LGFNIENASYSLSICAERTAAVSAILDGSRDFKELALSADGENFIVPCGACLQFLAEFSKNLDIVLVNGRGDKKNTTLKELLPVPFEL